ncbi:hypothetical protein FRB97_004580 [Tulasnella sp. 331]|nr:hypothetical protein FRB97_004580 [Tulasnella sp. 331]KAG8886718.1 hypothetical protein FRB98_001070 [Tulasnella sp. 332]
MSLLHVLRRGSTLCTAQRLLPHSPGPSTILRTLFTTSSLATEEVVDVAYESRHARKLESSEEPGDIVQFRKRTWNGSGLNPSEFNHQRYFLRLTGIPKTAIHGDVWRMLAKSGVTGCQNDYFRFVPLGAAWLSFATQGEQDAAKSVLRRAAMSTFPIVVENIEGSPFRSVRKRGTEGRENALQRGAVLIGNGPDGGVRERGTGIVLFGLPGKVHAETLYRNYLYRFELKGGVSDSIIKLERYDKSISCFAPQVALPHAICKSSNSDRTLTARFYVRLNCEAEAHRVVRSLHMNNYSPADYSDRYVMRARVVY